MQTLGETEYKTDLTAQGVEALEARRELPIGVFDSGVGGISVLRELVKLLPNEDFLFFGDSANAPYGTRTIPQITELTMKHVEHLREEGIKAVVIACNTATSAAIGALREKYTDMPVIGIEPALKPAAMMKENPNVVVMATPTTVHGDKFQKLMERFESRANVIPLACPGLVEYIEDGDLEAPELRCYLENQLGPYLGHVDAVVLGCTHYPFVRKLIKSIVGPDVPVIDGAEGTARELRRRLAAEGMLSERERTGHVTFEMSIKAKEKLAKYLLELENI